MEATAKHGFVAPARRDKTLWEPPSLRERGFSAHRLAGRCDVRYRL
jgi:hypothetical protein